MSNNKVKRFLIECPADIDEFALQAALDALNVKKHCHVLIDTSFGNLDIEPASLDEAKELVESILDYVPKRAIEIAVNKTKCISKDYVFNLLNVMLEKPVGTPVSKSITSTQERIDEIQKYAFTHKLDMKAGKLSNQSQFFEKTPDISVFSFFKGNEFYEGVELEDEYIVDIAKQYRPLFHNSWKEGATEIGIIARHLEFFKRFSNRDVHMELKKL